MTYLNLSVRNRQTFRFLLLNLEFWLLEMEEMMRGYANREKPSYIAVRVTTFLPSQDF